MLVQIMIILAMILMISTTPVLPQPRALIDHFTQDEESKNYILAGMDIDKHLIDRYRQQGELPLELNADILEQMGINGELVDMIATYSWDESSKTFNLAMRVNGGKSTWQTPHSGETLP